MRHRISRAALGVFFLCSAAMLHAGEPHRVEYTTSDGVVIIGDYWMPKDASAPAPAVILLHMYRSDRSAWRPLVPVLEEAGFAVLAIDMRGHGESIKPEDRKLEKRVRDRDPVLFRAMHRDVFGAYRWLQQRPEVDLSRLAIVGASVGCSVALDYAVRDKSVDTIVLMTPGENYLGVDSVEDIKQYGRRPVLMLTSEEERTNGTQALSELAREVELKTYSQAGVHGTKMFGKVPGVRQFMAAYLKKNIGSQSTDAVFGSVNSDVYHPAGSAEIERINDENRRIYSSAIEAERRGLRPSKN
jgi:pimeloyl-ACP methyl ester carboxylesterase